MRKVTVDCESGNVFETNIAYSAAIDEAISAYHEQLRQLVLASTMIERHRDESQLYSWQKPQELVPLEP